MYSKRKEEIYSHYNRFKKIDIDNLQEVNDKIIDSLLKKNYFKDDLEEFYNALSMCSYMIEHDLYDEVFFDDFDELLEEYKTHKFDNDIKDDKELLDKDVDRICDYLIKEKTKSNYYDKLSEMYDKE